MAIFTDKETVEIFPYPVWLFEVEHSKAAEINRIAVAQLNQLRSAERSLRPDDHWQSRNDLQTLPEFAELMEVIDAAARHALLELGVEYDAFLITGCWANVRPKGSEHPPHTHPNNYLSGTYYVQVPEGGNSIGFRDSRTETNIIVPRVKELTKYNTRSVVFPIDPGVLIMFPSWLPHYVPPNDGEIDRISISFNVMFTSFAEDISKPSWTFDPRSDVTPAADDATSGDTS